MNEIERGRETVAHIARKRTEPDPVKMPGFGVPFSLPGPDFDEAPVVFHLLDGAGEPLCRRDAIEGPHILSNGSGSSWSVNSLYPDCNF